MNTNALHNAINILISLIAALALFDWTAFFDPRTAIMIVGGLSLLKIVINVIRDGVSGLVKVQPPVVSEDYVPHLTGVPPRGSGAPDLGGDEPDYSAGQ